MNDGLSLLAQHPGVPRHLLTVEDYHRMGEAGILGPNDRVELIEGELVEMAPIGSEHAASSNALGRLLYGAVGERAILAAQNPVRLRPRNEPQPDFSILKLRPHGYYRSTLPTAEDVLLVAEVADSSLGYDKGPKLKLYARHRIPEVWIINLAAQEVEVYRAPEGDRYTSGIRVAPSGTLTIEALPGVSIPAAPIFE